MPTWVSLVIWIAILIMILGDIKEQYEIAKENDGTSAAHFALVRSVAGYIIIFYAVHRILDALF